jgi:hypothetical protein
MSKIIQEKMLHTNEVIRKSSRKNFDVDNSQNSHKLHSSAQKKKEKKDKSSSSSSMSDEVSGNDTKKTISTVKEDADESLVSPM